MNDHPKPLPNLYELEKRSIADRLRSCFRGMVAYQGDFYSWERARFAPCNVGYRDNLGFIYRIGVDTIDISTESLIAVHLEDEYKYYNKFKEYLNQLGLKTEPMCFNPWIIEIVIDSNLDVDRWINNKKDIETMYETLRDECNIESEPEKTRYNREMAILEARWRRSKRWLK